MEEHVGQLWHRLITQFAYQGYPEARVTLAEIKKKVGIFFRALGGEGGLQIEAVTTTHSARRTWRQRIAGTHQYAELAWRDQEILCLPIYIELFPDKKLNHELYLWLAALAARAIYIDEQNWFAYQQQLTVDVLKQFPGLIPRYQCLVNAYLLQRPSLTYLKSTEKSQEQIIQQALLYPERQFTLANTEKRPIHLWLHPSPPIKNPVVSTANQPTDDDSRTSVKKQEANEQRHQGKRVEMPDGKKGLLAFRLESLFTRAEQVNVDRCTDEEEDVEAAKQALEDMETINVARDNKRAAVALNFQVDLPSEENFSAISQEGILLPEWDYRQQKLCANRCHLHLIPLQVAEKTELPNHLRYLAQRLRRQFKSLIPLRTWHKNQSEGSEIDLESYLLHLTDSQLGEVKLGQNMYCDFRGGNRDLACLLLADLSMSTDAWVNNQARVIDIIKDSLYLFAEALSTTGDIFAMHGFCSYYREKVEFYTLKSFQQAYDATVRGRIHNIKPRFYTRMGAAIRYATQLLERQKTTQRLLLLLTDGKPNDVDLYEGRYGVEDTRMALQAARKQGLQVFCVTIDEKARDYLPHIFGSRHYIVIRNPADLPKELPLLYARLTQ